MLPLNPRELGTVLAGLRYWQRAIRADANDDVTSDDDYLSCLDVATDQGTLTKLTVAEIDELCERLNPPRQSPFQQNRDRVWALVDNSMDGYGNLIDNLLRRLTSTQMQELLESLDH